MSKLVKEAIAEARQVMELATENAKIALGEHFQREVTGIFQNKIKEEIEAEESNLQEKLKPSGIGKGVGKSKSPAKQPKTQVEKQPREKFFENDEENAEEEVVRETAMETPHEVSYEEEEEANHHEISDDELDEILKSLAEEADAAPADPNAPAPAPAPAAPPVDPNAPAPAPMDPNAPAHEEEQPAAPAPAPAPVAEMHCEEEEYDEGIDLEELLREIDCEHEEHEEDDDQEEEEEFVAHKDESVKHEEDDEAYLKKENAHLKKELNEHASAIQYLREQIKDINLLNAKLLYTNKLFSNNTLSKKQKINVIEKFDLATTLREVKYAYSILAESFNNSGASAVRKNTAVKSITEGLASSKPLASTKPSEAIVGNVNEMVTRFQHLANIKTGKK
jgi:hypothetical protein